MNDMNRYLIVLGAAAWIVLMAVVIFLTWAAPQESIDALADVVEFLDDNDDSAGKLVFTLAALALAVLGLLWIIVELAPEDEVKELRIEQAGATTIVPADALRMRLEEALLALDGVTAARSRVWPREKGVAVALDLTLTQTANAGDVTQRAVRLVVDTLHEDLGLPVSGTPEVRIAFGGSRTDGGGETAVTVQAPAPPPEPAPVSAEERPRFDPEMPPPPVSDQPAEPPPDRYVYGTPGDEERPGGEQSQQ